MNGLIRKLLLITITLSSTQIITLPISGLSVFQVALIFSLAIAFVGLVHKRYIKVGNYLLYSVIYAVSSVIALFVSINQSWAKSYFLLGIMTAMLIFLIPNYFSKKDLDLLEKSLIRSQYITIIFSIYGFYKFYFDNGIPEYIRLWGGLYIELEEEFFLRGQISGQLRLSLPYATPPVLSIVMAMCIIILLLNKKLYSKKKRVFLLISFSLILILTGSRTGVVALAIVGVIKGVPYLLNNNKINRKILLALVIVICCIPILLVISGNNVYLYKYFIRLNNIDVLNDRHILVPLDGLIIWLSSFKNFIIGIGFGSSAKMVGAHTYLPPYFLNSFVTLVAERGIFGLYLVCELIRLYRKNNKKVAGMTIPSQTAMNALIVAFVSFLFYEAINCYFIIITIAICYIIDLDKGEYNG